MTRKKSISAALSELRDLIARACFIDALNKHELEWFVYQVLTINGRRSYSTSLRVRSISKWQMVRQCTKGDNPEFDLLAKINEQLQKLQIDQA